MARDKQAERDYKDKLLKLHDLQRRQKAAGQREETPEYQRLSRDLDRLEKRVRWWRR